MTINVDGYNQTLRIQVVDKTAPGIVYQEFEVIAHPKAKPQEPFCGMERNWGIKDENDPDFLRQSTTPQAYVEWVKYHGGERRAYTTEGVLQWAKHCIEDHNKYVGKWIKWDDWSEEEYGMRRTCAQILNMWWTEPGLIPYYHFKTREGKEKIQDMPWQASYPCDTAEEAMHQWEVQDKRNAEYKASQAKEA